MSLLQDAKYGIRVLVKDRWFALFAILALALGIAVNNTVFTLVNAVLIRGLPFEDGNRVVWVGTRDAQKRDGPLSVMDFEDWRSRVKSFEGLSMWFSYPFNLTDADHEPERYPGVYVSENLFTLIRQQPILGRDFSPDDGRDGAPPVLIISHRVWTNRYGSDRGVLGRVVRLQGFQPTIIGVMPPDLHFPSDADLWVPIVHYPDLRTQERNARNFSALGRLAAGVTMQGAEAELSGIAGALAQQYPATNKDISAFVMSFSERQNGGPIRLIFLTLTGAVAFVLLIACANVANLLLARAANRSREICVRVALGASRWRIVRQLLVESLLLSLVAGVIGGLLSILGVRLFDMATQDVGKPSWIHFTMDWSVFAYLAAISLGTGVIFGLAPALHVSKTDVNEVLKEGGRTGTAGRRARWWTSALLVSELALTLVLLAGAGYMMRSFLALSSFDLGIDTSPLVTARVSLPNRKYPGNDQRVAFFQRLEERLNTIGGVEGAAVVSNPPGMGGGRRPFAIEGAPPTEAGETASRVTTVLVGPRYFDALGLGVIRGRALLETDGLPGQENVVVNKEFAETHFRGQDPLGQRFGFKNENEPPKTWMTIVGVVPNVRQRGMGPGLGDPGESNQPELVAYLPHRTNPGLGAAIVLRTRSNLGSLAPFLRSEMRTVDPELPLDEIRTLDESLARQRWPYSVFGSMFAFFAFVALLLSAVGLYAITAYSVTQRTQEIGVRMALGAQPTDVWWLVMRRALVHLSIGVTIGLAGAYGVGVLLQGFLVGSTPADPITLGAIALVLIGVALAACFAPARKATSLDPLAALRYE